jgi:hypothetical protein
MAHCTISLDTSVYPFGIQYSSSKYVHRGDTVSFLLAPGCTEPVTVSFESPSCFDGPPPPLTVTSTTAAVPAPALTVSDSAAYDRRYYFDLSHPEKEPMKGDLDVVPTSPPEED